MIAVHSHIAAKEYDAIYLQLPTVRQTYVSLITSLYSEDTVPRYVQQNVKRCYFLQMNGANSLYGSGL